MKLNNILQMIEQTEVAWKALGEVASFQNGFAFKSNFFKDEGLPIIRITNIDGELVNLSDVKYFDMKDYNMNLSAYEIQKGDVLLAMSGATTGKIGYYNYNYSAYLNQRVGKFIPNPNILENRYLYHFLLSKVQDIYIMSGGGVQPNLSSNRLMSEIYIPIPPISIQKEIVKVLDKLTELKATLKATLKAELSLREKQYHYYRDHLLTFGDDVEWKSLGDVVLSTKNIKWKNDNEIYQYIDLTSVDLVNKTIIQTSKINRENAPSRAQKLVATNDVIFATTRPTQMRVTVIPKEFDGQIASTGYCVLRADKSKILSKWIYFNLSTKVFEQYLEDNQSGSAYPAISDSKLKDFKIPIPPLATQQKIVAILDKFERLTHSITEGLPKEIELREKQYQHYREKLLGFSK